MSGLGAIARNELVELAPVLRRTVALDPAGVARVRATQQQVSVVVRLPFDVLVSRTLAADTLGPGFDVTMRADELLAWLDGERATPPESRDADWRSSLPPARGWRRVDTVPDDVVRGLVRAGARAIEDAAVRAGVPGAQPRAQLIDALLASVVLTVTADDGGVSAALTLRTLSALTRMGFLSRGSHVGVDVVGRWTRVAAHYGSVYSESAGLGLTLR